MTSWAALALMYAQYPEPEPIERAMRMVMSRQQPVGLFYFLAPLYRREFPFNLILFSPSGWFMEAGGD